MDQGIDQDTSKKCLLEVDSKQHKDPQVEKVRSEKLWSTQS